MAPAAPAAVPAAPHRLRRLASRVPRPTWRSAAVLVVTGVGAGVTGGVLTLLLHAVQHLAYGYSAEPFAVGAGQASPARRVLAMVGGGLVVGTGWWALQRWSRADTSVIVALTDPARRPALPATVADGALQITAVGAGASLGREGAPRQVAAAVAGWAAARAGLTPARRRTYLACGAGAGLAAVYNVPLGGALFTLEVLLGSVALADVVPAVLTAGIATVVAWPVVGRAPTYAVPPVAFSWSLLVAALLLGPVAAVAGRGFTLLMRAARHRPVRGWPLVLTVPAAFGLVAALAAWMPLVLGNGKGPAESAFTAALSVPTLAVLLGLRPLATAVCLRGGAVGGLLTPAVATGALLGGLAGTGWERLWPGSTPGTLAVVGAAAVLAVTQRAPATAAVLAVEFTHVGPAAWPAVAVAVAGAALAGRLPALGGGDVRREASAARRRRRRTG